MKMFEGLYAYVWGTAFLDSSNSYIIKDDVSVIIDPGCYKSFTNLFGLMKNDKIEVSDIDVVFNTHLHKDHCESNPIFLKKGALLAFHELERDFTCYSFTPDLPVSNLKYYNTGRYNLELIHTPGHTPGSISVYIEEFGTAITGDLIFENGIPGRTDLYGGNTRSILKSLEKIQSLDPDYILPGHGRILSGRSGIRELFEKAIQIIAAKNSD
ncbi:MBL fold metallo-hydrolase [Archaeoglobales archaeon]|nr:MAG: MBL fold metallo-hydrolase [Archaeoglobales archaeon]